MSSKYDELRKIWDKKLKKTKSEEYPNGFEDYETSDGKLKRWSTDFRRQQSLDSWEAKEAYYRYCRYFLNDYTFKTRREEIIWEYHAEGISIRDIVTLLKKVRIKMNRDSVWHVVNELQTVMKSMYMNGENNEWFQGFIRY